LFKIFELASQNLINLDRRTEKKGKNPKHVLLREEVNVWRKRKNRVNDAWRNNVDETAAKVVIKYMNIEQLRAMVGGGVTPLAPHPFHACPHTSRLDLLL
jgi:hypothetical protein